MTVDLPLSKEKYARAYYKASAKNDELREQNARLREALEFYADESKYECDCLGYDNDNRYYFSKPEITEDYGETARKVLGVSK